MTRTALVFGLLLAICFAAVAQNPVGQTRDQKVRGDKAKVEADGFWIYNDLNRGYAEAKKTGQPIIVVLRCIPCEQCVKLDDDLVDKDERLRPLLEKFVRVRLISANGLDLSLFQYDTDQSFAVFLMNAVGNDKPELYDLASDIGESRDLSNSKPEVFKDVTARYDAWNKTLVEPRWGQPNAEKAAKRKKAKAAN